MRDMLWKLDRIQLSGRVQPRLDNITLEIGRGITAVLGCSGAGKTSLLNLLVEFEQPERGTIVADLPRSTHSLPLYWVPQSAGLWPHLTVRRHLETTAAPGVGGREIEEILALFDLHDKGASRPDELSQGERSRLALARALAARPAVLVMDEPLVSVDPGRADRCWKAVRRYASETRASIVYATHSPKMVLGEAERVICLKEGLLLYSGEVNDLYLRPPSREAAECLGEANWLEPGEARVWLHEGKDAARCYRPEQISVSKVDASPLVVQSYCFKGSVAEAVLKHEKVGKVRSFYHRPASDGLHAGDRVLLRVIVSLLLLLMVSCSKAREPALAVSKVRLWAMPPDGPKIPAPRSVAIGHNDEVIVLDTAGRVLVFDAGGEVRRRWRMPDTKVGRPEGACVMKDGRIAVADTHYHRVVIFNPDGSIHRTFGRDGRGPGQFIYPVAAVQDDRQNLYVCEYGGNDRVQKFAPDGTHLLSFGSFGTGEGQFQRPSGMVWHAGKVYVADAMNNRIQVFSDSGRFLRAIGNSPDHPSFHFPYDISMGADGALYVIEYGACRVSKLNLEGKPLGRYGSAGRAKGEFFTPWALACDSKGRVRVADTGNRRIVTLEL